MKQEIEFGSETIQFKLEYSQRKTLGITVTPGMEVIVKSPVDATEEKIKEKLRLRAPWILKQQSYFLAFHPKAIEKKYLAGETHYYLGRQYRLQIIAGSSDSVKLKGKFLEVTTSDKTTIENVVKTWYLQHAKLKFNQIAKPLIQQFKKYNVEPSTIMLRHMPSRWGSCTPNGKIILNPELIKAPKRCIEYVIIHELCHLIHHDHTRKFLDLQSKEMPDWAKWKNKLEKMLA